MEPPKVETAERSMPRTLSSAQTFFTKFIFPALWIGIFGMGTVVLFATERLSHHPGARAVADVKWLFLAVWIVGSAFIYWACGRLKRVRMDDSSLYISNYVREVRVPLLQVRAVTENRWINIHPVAIEFRAATAFGDRVVFMPKLRWFASWSSHPVVEEIREAAERAVGLRPGPR